MNKINIIIKRKKKRHKKIITHFYQKFINKISFKIILIPQINKYFNKINNNMVITKYSIKMNRLNYKIIIQIK